MLTVEFRGAEKMAHDLAKVKRTALPYAARDAINSAAFAARKVWGDQIRKSFTTRNQFTAGRALEVVRAKGTRVNEMEAVLGSIAYYMPRQEFGATVKGKGAHKGIPGPVAAGQAPGGRRLRPVRRANLLGAIRAAKGGKGATRAQRNAVAIAIAKRRGLKHAVLERPKGGKGLFVIAGGKRKTKTKLVWDISRKSVKIEPEPTLGPTLERIGRTMELHQRAALLKQLKFHRICGY